MTSFRTYFIVASLAGLLLAIGLGFSSYLYLELLDRSSADSAASQASLVDLEERLENSEADRRALEDALAAERAKTGSFERQISDIYGTVGTLKKLSETDPELLAKYSKVYFLNENYVPSALSTIDATYLADASRTLEFHARALPFLVKMIGDAEEDGVELRVASAFRSFGTQAALKSNYVVAYGGGANRFSADQGYSEHQLGTTVDFSTKALGTSFTAFGNTEGYAWLTDNAQRYGFILSYPPGNTHYISEPWHWRFVGVDLARDLHEEGRSFYELDQREINEYLVSLFD